MRQGLQVDAVHGGRTRRGVTIVEVLVTISILGLLFAILLPAIFATRGSANAVTCRARMSQIGRAVHNFEERNGRYPNGKGFLDWQFELLPDLDRSELYRQLDGHEEEPIVIGPICHATSVPILQCPTDSAIRTHKYAINFLLNGGEKDRRYEEDDPSGFDTGLLSSRDVVDGLSTTVFVCEKMNEFLFSSPDRRGEWRTPTMYTSLNQLDLFADECEAMPEGAAGGPFEGNLLTFFDGSMVYDHIARPNRASCSNYFGCVTANSNHVGGVHVLMADGAVRFVNDHVTRPVWRAMGTRNRHESVSLP